MRDRDQSRLAGAEELARDKMRRYAVTRAAEIVGEAATNGSVESRAAVAAVPWRSVIGLRNDAVRNHFPPPIEMLREALGDSQP